MSERSLDWLRQAGKDLEKAKLDLEWRYYEWACFTSQQAAEKAIKGLYQSLHGEAWGHGVMELLLKLPIEGKETLLKEARFLDKFYIPTRYPNSLPSGIPHDYFTREEAEKTVEAAEKIIAWCKSKIS